MLEYATDYDQGVYQHKQAKLPGRKPKELDRPVYLAHRPHIR